jgi:gliding motility-associated-like protein
MLAPTYGGQPLTYLWTPASYLNNASIAEPLCTPKTDTLYTITATNQYNCSLSDSIYVSVLLMPLIPNVFSPNGDGVHDKWHIEFLNKYPNCIVDVFDRNGQTVFHEYTYSEEWDGKCNGKPVPMGTYFYVIKPNSGREPITGSITILR